VKRYQSTSPIGSIAAPSVTQEAVTVAAACDPLGSVSAAGGTAPR
jgi:hypothetical protein